MLGKTPNHLSAVERGASGISLEALQRLCRLLGVSADRIIFGTDKPEAKANNRGLQQQNEGPQARLLRDAELQKSDPFLQRCTEKTAPGLSTPTRSWIIVFFASTPAIDIEPLL